MGMKLLYMCFPPLYPVDDNTIGMQCYHLYYNIIIIATCTLLTVAQFEDCSGSVSPTEGPRNTYIVHNIVGDP